MRRRTAGWLLASAAAPLLLAGVGSAVLRVQATRLRRDFDAGAPPPGTVPNLHRATVLPRVPAPEASADAALAVIGDSWVSGTGTGDPAQRLARGLAALTGQTVRLSNSAVASARADQVSAQVDRIVSDPHLRSAAGLRLAVLSMGTGDVIHPVSGSLTLGVFTAALTRLQRADFEVVVLCCPNLASLPGTRNPLRRFMRRSSRVLAGSQRLAAIAAGAHPVHTTLLLSGTTRVGLLESSGRRPSGLGAAQLAAGVLAAVAERLELESTSAGTSDPD